MIFYVLLFFLQINEISNMKYVLNQKLITKFTQMTLVNYIISIKYSL